MLKYAQGIFLYKEKTSKCTKVYFYLMSLMNDPLINIDGALPVYQILSQVLGRSVDSFDKNSALQGFCF